MGLRATAEKKAEEVFFPQQTEAGKGKELRNQKEAAKISGQRQIRTNVTSSEGADEVA